MLFSRYLHFCVFNGYQKFKNCDIIIIIDITTHRKVDF